ncbi:pilin [Patescibacteria group bacterium]|nr:pilin [Patescibacteria group bacterium]
MKKIGSILAPALSYLAITPTVLAGDTNADPSKGLPPPFDRLVNLTTNFGETVGKLITAIFVIATIISLFYLIYGAVKWIISEGDKQKVADARNHIIAALVGLVIVFLSYFILSIILGIFGIKFEDLKIPAITV